jgi:CubicO group peptidase (beta-lactamase class C family)
MDESSDWLAFAYATPMKWQPGERYVYSSLIAFLAGAVVEHAARMPLAAFAEQHLFGPLGITRYSWRRGPRGEGAGQGIYASACATWPKSVSSSSTKVPMAAGRS